MKPLDPRLLRYAAATRPYLAGSVLIGVALAVLVVAQAVLLGGAIAAAFLDGATLARLSGTLTWLAVVLVARAALTGVQELLARRSSSRVQAQLRERLVEAVLSLGPDWLAGQQSTRLALLGTRGTSALDGYFSRYLPQLLLAGLVPLVVLAWMLPADLTAFVVVALTLPLIPVFMALVGVTTGERTRRQWTALETMGHHFLDVVSGLTTLKAYGRARRQAAVIARVTADHRRATMAVLRLAFLSSLVLELLASLSVALVAVAVGLRVVDGGLDLRTALTVLMLAPEAYLPLRQLGASYHASAEGLAAVDGVVSVLDEAAAASPAVASPAAADGAVVLPDPVEAVRLDGVVVVRTGRPDPVLDGLDLELRRGELVVLTGPSGSGKSTALALLLGFLRPGSGQVVVRGCDGVELPLCRLDLRDWRDRIGWVPQSPHVFAGTVADNVRLGARSATDADVRRALDEAGGLLDELPDGIGTRVGDGGVGLSAGQVRRLALARALARRPEILLLDEPTAGLDVTAEAGVVAALLARPAGQSVLAVSHRPALVAVADRVVLVDLTAPAYVLPGAQPADLTAAVAG